MHLVLALTLALAASEGQSQQTPPPPPPDTGAQQPAPEPKKADDADKPPPADADSNRQPDRLFGVLPNYTTVESANLPPIDTRQTFVMASYSSFDPFVFPFVGLVAAVAQVTDQESSWGGGPQAYAKRYAMAF